MALGRGVTAGALIVGVAHPASAQDNPQALKQEIDQLRRDWFVPDNVRLEVDPDRLFFVGTSKTQPELVYAAGKGELPSSAYVDDLSNVSIC